MIEQTDPSPREHQVDAEHLKVSRKPYRTPSLVELGDLRTLTLGLSPTGYFDSGGGSIYENYP
jgi:hypothetical protein